MAEPTSFEITWRDGAYYVSIPNYKGGTVYTAAEHDRLTRENEAQRAALMDVAARARFELDHPTEMRDTAFSLIEKSASSALALKEPGQ
jgi:hypothetical protein